MLWLHIIKGMKDKMNEPGFLMELEREKQRPGYRRRHYLQVAALLLLLAVLIFFWLRGWEIVIP